MDGQRAVFGKGLTLGAKVKQNKVYRSCIPDKLTVHALNPNGVSVLIDVEREK